MWNYRKGNERYGPIKYKLIYIPKSAVINWQFKNEYWCHN